MNKHESEKLAERIRVFSAYMPDRTYISPVLVTSNGVIRNKYSDEIANQVTGEQLFLP